MSFSVRRNAAGQIVWCQDKPCTVRGTWLVCGESSRNLMIRQVREEDGETLRAVSMKLSDTDQAAAQTQQFSLKYGLTGEWVDFIFWGALAQDLLLLLPGILCGAGVRQLARTGREMGTSWGKAAFYLGGGLLGVGAVLVLSGYFYGAGIYDSRRMVGFFFLGRLLGPAEEQSSDHPPDRSGRGAADHAWPLRDLGAGKYFFRSRVRDDAEVKTRTVILVTHELDNDAKKGKADACREDKD